MFVNKVSFQIKILIFAIALFVLVSALNVVCYLFFVKNTPPVAVSPTVTPIIQSPLVPTITPLISSNEPKIENLILNEIDNEFLDKLLSEIPKNYIKFDTQHTESLRDKNPKNAIGIKPCESADNDDPALKPKCFTVLSIWKNSENISNINNYVNNDEIFSWYEKAIGVELIRTTNNEGAQVVYTPKSFMCPGTGGESCLRYQYAYLLENGDIIKAEISYWSFENGEYIQKTPKDVMDIVEIYKNILLKK